MIEFLRPDWPLAGTVNAGTTLRGGGISRGCYRSLNLGARAGDDNDSVVENRRRFRDAIGLDREPRWLEQVHGTQVAEVGGKVIEADAAIAREPGVCCVVQTADCLPILISSADGREVAAIHAGWRGLAAGVIGETLRRLKSPTSSLIAWLGPAISQQNFEVGEDVRQAFVDTSAAAAAAFLENHRGRFQADLYALARQQLDAADVCQISGGEHCTYADSQRFFSYRRDGECGRMATFIVCH